MKKHRYYYRNKIKICLKFCIELKNLQILKKNFKLKKTLKQKIIIKMFKINKNFNFNKLKKFCYFTGKLRFIVHKQCLSRMTFREHCSKGLISGFFKK